MRAEVAPELTGNQGTKMVPGLNPKTFVANDPPTTPGFPGLGRVVQDPSEDPKKHGFIIRIPKFPICSAF